MGRYSLVWTMSGGIPVSRAFAKTADQSASKGADFTFVQISDSHISFNEPAKPDVTATLQTAINKINAMPHKSDFIIHTGDLSQLSKPSEFDTLDQVLKGASAKQTYFVPGEHDMLTDNGEQYLQRYGKGTRGSGWYSFDHKGVHFVGLANVANSRHTMPRSLSIPSKNPISITRKYIPGASDGRFFRVLFAIGSTPVVIPSRTNPFNRAHGCEIWAET